MSIKIRTRMWGEGVWKERLHLFCVCVQSCLTATLRTVVRQTSLSIGCSRPKYWSGLPFPPPGDLPDPGIKPTSLCLLHWQVDFFTTEPPGKPIYHSREKNFRNIDLTRNIQNIYQQQKVKVTQSCWTLCDPMDYTVHGILQARILAWVAFSLLQEIFPTQGLNPSLPHCRQILYQLIHKGSPRILEWVAYPSPADLPDPGIEPESPALQLESLPTDL